MVIALSIFTRSTFLMFFRYVEFFNPLTWMFLRMTFSSGSPSWSARYWRVVVRQMVGYVAIAVIGAKHFP